MKSFLSNARNRLAQATTTTTTTTSTSTTATATANAPTTFKKGSPINLTLTTSQRSQNKSLALSIDQLIIMSGVVRKFTTDMEKFLDTVQQLCVQHIMMADGFRIMFAKSHIDASDTFAYSNSCSKLANGVRGHTENALQKRVFLPLSDKTQVIHQLEHRVIQWQNAHALFFTALSVARKKHFKAGHTASVEMDPNDVSKIRLAECECDNLARGLIVDIQHLHHSRFDWIRDIVSAFKEIQAQFYISAGTTLGQGSGGMDGLESGDGHDRATAAATATTATTATTADAPRHPKDSKLEDSKEVVVATVGEELANIMSEERTIVRQKEVDLTWLMGFMCAKETDLDRKERDFAMHTFQHKSLEYKGAEDDPVTVAFAGIDVDIERTGARKNHGRTKRGGKLTGYTAKYKGDDSQDALASLVASALGTTSRSATEEDVHVDVDVGEGEQEKEKGEEQGNIEREPPQEPPHEQQLQQQHEHEAHVRTVLRAFAIVDNDAVHGSGLCYSQGLNFLVSALLSRCGRDGGPVEGQWGGTTQAACFGMFWWLVRGPSRLIDVYAKHFEGLQHCFTTLNKLMLVHFPRVVDHFNECNVKVSMFATSWFTTLFTNYDTLPRLYVARILDIFIVDGWNFVYQVALAIVSALRLELLGSDFEAILRIVQDPEPIIVAAYTTPEALVQAADQFEME